MPEDVKAPVAEPSAAPVQFDGWDEKGTPIVTKKSEPTSQEPVPADKAKEPAKPEAKAESAAESGAAKDQSQGHKGKGKLTADERIAQLEATIERIRAEKDKPREIERKADSQPAAQPQPAKAPEAPKKPKLEDFKTYEEYETAKDDYFEKLADFKAEQKAAEALQRDREARQLEEQRKQVNREFEDAKKVYPDFEEKAKPVIEKLIGEHRDAAIPEPFVRAIGTSDVFTHLTYALSGEQMDALFDLSKKDLVSALKKLGALESTVREQLAKSKPQPAAAKPEKEEAPAPTKPKAPPPPSEVSGTGGATGERADVAAARAGDFRSFEAEQNRRKFSSAR